MQKENLEMTEIMKLKADQSKESTLLKMLSKDEGYQESLKQLSLLEQLYGNLDLTKAQRSAVNAYLELLDDVSSDYGTYAYLAGLIDSDRELDLKKMAASEEEA